MVSTRSVSINGLWRVIYILIWVCLLDFFYKRKSHFIFIKGKSV